MANSTDDSRRCSILIANGRANIANGVTMNASANSIRNYIQITGTGIFDLQGGNFNNGGQFIPVTNPLLPNQSRAIYSGANNQNIRAAQNNYFHLELRHNASSTKSLTTNTTVLGDLLSVGNAAKPDFQMGANDLTVVGTTTLRLANMTDNNPNGNVQLNNLVMEGGRLNCSFTETITVLGALTVNTNPTTSISEIGNLNLTVQGTTQIAAGATLEWNNAIGTKTLVGKVTINGAWNNTANEDLTMQGGLEHNGISFNSGTGTYSFTSPLPLLPYTQTISGTSSIVFNGQVIVGDNVRLINNVSEPSNGLVINNLLDGGNLLSVFENRTLLRYGGLNQRPMNTGGLDADHPDNVVDYFAAAGTQIINSSDIPSTTVYHHLVISGGGEKQWLNTNLSIPGYTRYINGNLTIRGGTLLLIQANAATEPVIVVRGNYIQEGGTLNLSARNGSGGQAQLNIQGNFTQTGGTVTVTGSSAGALNSTVRMNGNATQTAFQSTAVSWVRGIFAVRNPNRVVLQSNFSAFRLSLEAGILQTGSTGLEYEFRVTDNAVAAVMNHVTTGFNFTMRTYATLPDNYIFGRLRRNIQNTSGLTYDFPVGSNLRYELARLTITAPLNVSQISATFIATDALGNFSVPTCIRSYAPCTGGFWTITADAAISGTYSLQLFPYGFICGNNNDCGGPTIARRADSTAAWGFSGSTFAPNYTRTGFTAFSDFVPVFEDQLTPVEWVSFTAQRQENGALLQWATAWEKDAASFGIEKSRDGQRWIQIGKVAAQGNSNTLKQYRFTDNEPFTGINYYRLAQRDWDGTVHYSAVVSLSWEEIALRGNLRLFPNPVQTGGKIQLHEAFLAEQITLWDMSGREVYRLQTTEGETSLQLPNLAKGVYLLKAEGKGQSAVARLVIE